MFANALKSFSSAIAANYEKSASPISTCGPWKIYDAKKKKTNQPASIWVFERKALDNSNSGVSLRNTSKDGLKAAQDEVVDRLRREASLLARLRHPCVLELMEPVEDTRSGGLQFVTEAVTGSLTTLLREKDEEERSGGARNRRREVEIDELEIQKGVLQIGKALEFLHESANLIHGNLTPDAVIVNSKSDWKLCGLGFAAASTNPPLPPEFDHRLPSSVQLQLDYAAPDLVLDQTLTTSCDLFSLGILMIALYNHPHKSPIESHNSASTYRRLLSSPQTTPNTGNNFLSARPVPRQLTGSVLPRLITRRTTGRMSARDFQQSEYFDNILVSTLRFLDQFPAKMPSEKAAFMRGLPKILPQFPRSVLEKKILPGLIEELRDGSLLALILPNIFYIAEAASSLLFSEKILKRVKEVFITAGGGASTSEPKTAAAKAAEREREAGKEGGLTVILSKLGLIKEKTTAKEFKEDILPLVFLALDSPTHALQDLALRSLPTILPKLDFPTLKNELFPVVAGVFTKTSSLGIKIRGLEAFRVLCGGSGGDESGGLDGMSGKGKTRGDEAPVLDKYTIQEKVIPLLKGIKTKEPAVMMETLSVFQEIGKTCDREIVAMDILPTLWTMSFGPLLGLEQFKAFMSTIKSLSQKIEAEQTRKLQDLSSSTPNGQSAGDFLSFGGAPGLNALNGRVSPGGETDFERLVSGKKEAPAAPDGFSWQTAGTPTPTSSFNTSPTSTSSFNSTPAVPSIQRSKSPGLLTTSAPKFAWSTPSPTSPNTQAAAVASLGSFSPLKPAVSPAPGFGSTAAFRPPSSQAISSGTNAAIDWSVAMKPKPQMNSVPMNPMPMSQTPMNPVPMNAMMSGLNLGGSGQSAFGGGSTGFGIPPPPRPGGGGGGSIQLTNFGGGITPKPAATGMGMGMGGAAAAGGGSGGGFNMMPKKEEKQGLDKWESLI